MPKQKVPANRFKVERVKSAKGRKISSTLWLKRQLNDPFVKQAKIDGYRSRAAYKLIEIDDKYKFLKPGKSLLDLGAAPGSWSQVILERFTNKKGEFKGKIIAVDIQELAPIANVQFIKGDIESQEVLDILSKMEKVDIVLSDMAASSSGHSKTDHIRIIALCEAAFDIAIKSLNKDGVFITKVLRGGTEGELLKKIKKYFDRVEHFKPKASRQDSSEIYLVATKFNNKNN